MLQQYRDINIKIEVLDWTLYIVDEISGFVESASFNIDADSDVRRTCSISMQLRSEFSNSSYWTVGNSWWFDKYIRINIGILDIFTGEYVWHNQGTYLVNEPTVTYNAENNTLDFSAVDMMCKLTGMRNGVLTGVERTINAGTNIINLMTDVLEEQGVKLYSLNEPPQKTTPQDINLSAGSTAYDLLSKLCEINIGWEMFFDEDGLFHFQAIPNEDNISDGGAVVPVVDNSTFEALSLGYTLNTSFEDVKNYVEVYGEYIEFNVKGETEVVGNTIKVTFPADSFDDSSMKLCGFFVGDDTQPATKKSFTAIDIFEGDTQIATINTGNLPKYTNWDYRLRATGRSFEYLGYAQPFGLAWENRETSPFYVGDLISGDSTNNPTDALDALPIFSKQVRDVCSGGDYANLFSNNDCMACAKNEIYKKARRHDSIEIELVPIYWIGCNQLIEYRLPNEETTSLWLVKSINTTFGAEGTQTISAVKQYI